jgi:hypothetical protein
MSPIASGLLGLLGVGSGQTVQPSGLTSGQVEGSDFASLLQLARQGQVTSDRPVSIANGANVKLSPDQMQRLAVAADRAESQGATRALVMIDGMAVKLDVSMRQVTGLADLSKPGVMTGIDCLVTTASPDPNAAAAVPLPRAPGLASPSLLRALSGASSTNR